MKIMTLGIDLAKEVLHVHGKRARRKVVVNPLFGTEILPAGSCGQIETTAACESLLKDPFSMLHYH